MEVDRNGLEVLDRDECLRLLALASIGRIGFTSGALPTVLPVNFHLDRERILVRTGRGSKLDAAMRNAVVAFEVDNFNALYHSGWSVAVTGVATEVSDPVELKQVRTLPIGRWAPKGDEAVLAISTELVSGRRISGNTLLTRR
jgi:nitroimidazol reductase NimA-like FMN-containing flavoprotein (pyridoxamine 5'-phosphate oxidase superfamily)